MSSLPPAPQPSSAPAPVPARAASSSSSTHIIPPHAHAHGHCPITGAHSHAYCPRQHGDSRSPCPALNTLANHGYLPRDGKCITPAVLIHALRAGYHLSYPLAAFLTHGGFFLIGQRRRRICLHDLSRHNCIEHDASLVHPDVAFRDEYAPVDIHLHMLDDLMRYSTDGTLMTPDDVARARVAREAQYAIPIDKVHAEIARGEMAIVLQLFNNPDNLAPHEPPRPSLLTRIRRRLFALAPPPAPAPAPPQPAPLRGVPNEMLRVWMHEERLPDGWTPYHRVGLLHTMRMATRLRRSMRALEKENRKSARARARTIDGAVAALVPALTIATPERRDTATDTARAIVVETGAVGGVPVSVPVGATGSPVTVDSPGAMASPQSTVSSRASSDGLRTPVDVPFASPAPMPGAGFAKVRENVAVYPVQEEEEGLFERIKERTNTIDSMIAVVA